MKRSPGALTLAEFAFPCLFVDRQEATGIDIAGAVIDRLLAKLGETVAMGDELRRRGDPARAPVMHGTTPAGESGQ